MREIMMKNKRISIDDDGFLHDMEDWNEELAGYLATKEGLEGLSTKKLEIVKFMRNYYKQHKAFPILNYVCKNIHQPKECVNEEFVNPLMAWKIAGLPHPSGIHFVSLDGEHYRLEECC